MALTLQSEGSVSEEAGGLSEEVEGKVAAAATLEKPGCSGAGALYEQGSRSESSCEGNEEMEDEEEMMEEGTAGSGAAALFGGFGTEEGEMDCDDEDERMINLSELVPYIMCSICKGYFIDATTITECLHTFCKSCIVRHFYYSNRCPKCNIVVHQTQPLYNIRLDRQLQDIVYKLVVNLEEREKKRMHDFYRERGLEIPKLAAPQPMAVGRGRPRKVVGSVFRLPPELDMSLLLEFIGANDLSGNFKPLEKKFVRVSGEATIGHVEKFLRRKMDLDPGCQVDIICGDHLLEHYQTLREIQNALGKSAVQDGLLILHYGLILSGDSTFSKIS
ncbi:polycomb group RING finger protein 6 [Protobothrops mucrosquamatus]|uniref:polycomb group RING finger protein 6 n=1 Tax=Protobothrops mucrosquamatus TaxID=103944 RepID=UPI0007758D6C|nr:polycomb group RING finger protein 6 [Protobothrops mucrosquamatus]